CKRLLASLPLALAYSLHALEAADEAHGVRSRRQPALQQLARAAAVRAPTGDPQPARQLALAHLLLLLPAAGGRRLGQLSLADADLLSSLVVLTFLLPYLYLRDCRPRVACTAPVCAASEACLVRLFYTARLVQVFLDLPDCDEGEGDESDGADGDTPLDQLVTSYRFAAGLWSSPAASGAQLAADVRAAAAPFLRSAVRLYACLSGRDGAASPESGITDEEAEFRRLAELLRLPADPCHLFAASPAAADLASH
uniref:PRT6_C domain-containing protein n=1 Tax=Macrostomum lignano TaxID=282301 RepID=A0A1I8H733_9PLAT